MPDSVRKLAFDALETRLSTIDDVTVFRMPRGAIKASECPAIVIYEGGHAAPTVDVGIKHYSTNCSLTLIVADSDTLGDAITALYTSVIQAIVSDHTLGGAVVDVDEGGLSDPEIIDEEGAERLAMADLDLTLLIDTLEDDPLTAG